ncbi:hypothetical protein [Paraburkholderia sp. RL17-373-BIF-A]|uniref:hypothetical protein n=1 Tax=Paraburkholderia sp. RL17-373-BIF-A TaxID=3031629 RepID=UPI0038B6F626
MKRVTVLKARINELQGELERATRERTDALKAVAADPTSEPAHERLNAAVLGCKQISGIIAQLEEAIEDAKTADDADVLDSHRTDMLAARDRAQTAVIARVQIGAKIDKILSTLQAALTEWHTATNEARRELSLATIGALDHERLAQGLFDNRVMQLGAVTQQLEHASQVPLAFAQALRRAGVCGPVGSQSVTPGEGPIPLGAFIDFKEQAAGPMVLHTPGTVREAAQQAADSFLCSLDNWHARCNVIDMPAPTETTPDDDDDPMPSADDESRENYDE